MIAKWCITPSQLGSHFRAKKKKKQKKKKKKKKKKNGFYYDHGDGSVDYTDRNDDNDHADDDDDDDAGDGDDDNDDKDAPTVLDARAGCPQSGASAWGVPGQCHPGPGHRAVP